MNADECLAQWEEFFEKKNSRRIDSAAYLAIVERLIRGGFPPILEIAHLAALVGQKTNDIAAQAASPKTFYRSFTIPKRSGGRRELSSPVPSLMATQRWINENILKNIAAHDAAHGFVEKRSVVTNANMHVGAECALRLDLKDFFPSIPLRRGIAIFMRCGYTPAVSYLLASICFLDGRLPQGAPTSPAISNIVAKRMDARIHGLSQQRGLHYTRYADDICISGKKIGNDILFASRSIIKSEGFSLNDDKTRFMNRNSKMIIAGVSISRGRLTLPRTSVREIKKKCHWLLQFGLYNHFDRTGERDPIVIERLIGRLGFWLQVEPENKTALEYMARLKEYEPPIELVA